MSYARFGPTSDVYIYSDGVSFHCLHAGNEESHLLDNEVQMLNHAYEDQEAGLKVPDKVFGRLLNEITGIPYETDIQAELDELRAMLGEHGIKEEHE